jgi:hypothetical protein
MMRLAIVLIVSGLLVSGCDLFENPAPDEARLIIQGDTGKLVRVIVSTSFVAAITPEGQTRVAVFAADTFLTRLPFDTVYDIERDQRFFAETARLDTDLQTVSMQVFVGRRKQFEEGGVLLEGRPYRFAYTFNQPITKEIVVI